MLQQRGAAHHHAGRAIAALHRIMLDEGRLHRMQRIALRQSLDGGHRAGADINGQQHAGGNRRAIQPNRAGRASAAVAADFRAGEIEWPAQHLGQRGARLHGHRARHAIDAQGQRYRAWPRDCRRVRLGRKGGVRVAQQDRAACGNPRAAEERSARYRCCMIGICHEHAPCLDARSRPGAPVGESIRPAARGPP